MVAVLDRPRKRTPIAHKRIREDTARTSGPLQVDRDKRIIYGVKVCGTESKNGRRYPASTLREALPLYNNAAVYLNHPGKEAGSRDADDLLGKIINPQLRADGIYGDFEYLAADKRMDKFCEVAERMSEQLGFSHNIEADGEYQGDTLVVTKITEVQSVDLVADPATTRGIFEGHQVAQTFREFLESKTDSKLAAKWLSEDDVPALDMPAPAADAGAPPPDDVGSHKADMLAAIGKLLDSTDPKDQELAASIMKLLQKYSAPEKATEDEVGDDIEGDVKEDDLDGDSKPTSKQTDQDHKESVQVQLSRAKLQLAGYKLCESLGFFPSSLQVEALAGLSSDEKRRQLAQTFKPAQTNGRRPQSAAPIGLHESNGKQLSPEEAGRYFHD